MYQIYVETLVCIVSMSTGVPSKDRDTELVTPLGCYNVTYTINVNAIFLHNIPFLQTRFSDHKLYIY